MATIVKLKGSDSHAILVGVGYGQFKSARPSALFGNMAPTELSGDSTMAAVSTEAGKILWCSTDDLEVVSIDGESPTELLRPFFQKEE